jgi:hypothetical protein
MILGLLTSLMFLSGSKGTPITTPLGFQGIKPISVLNGPAVNQQLEEEAAKERKRRALIFKQREQREKKDHDKKPNHRGGRDLEDDNPLDQLLWMRQTLLDNSGTIPAYGLKKAYAEREASIAYQNLNRSKSLDPLMALPTEAPWVSRGPYQIGGRTRSMIVMPDGITLLAGSVGGGVWRSTDSGNTWAPINDHMQNIAIGTMVQDPTNANHIYAGTGEAFGNQDSDQGAGIFESTDGGLHFNLITSTAAFGNVAAMAICPTNHNLVMASTVSGAGGIQRSTNGGQTWTTVRSALGSMAVAFDPFDSTHLLAHIISVDSSSNYAHTAYYSLDSGQTWIASTGMGPFAGIRNGRMSFTYSKKTQNLVYCSAGNDGGQVFKSMDGGKTWAAASGTNIFLQAWYNNFIYIDPTNDNTLFLSDNPDSDLLQKSTDGGANWFTISDGYSTSVDPHADVHNAVTDPGFDGNANQRVYFLTDGGIYRTDNIKTAAPDFGWTNLDNGYVTGQYYSVDGDISGIFAGGLQDNYTELTVDPAVISNPNLTTNFGYALFGGDGGFTAIDHTSPGYVYGEYVYLDLFSTFGSVNPTALDPTGNTNDGFHSDWIYFGIPDSNDSSRCNFISPFILDPNNQLTLLAGGTKLWRTTNARATSPVFTAIRQDGPNVAGLLNKISTIQVAPGNSNIIWVGQNNGVISKTSNGTAATPTWTNLTGPQTRYVHHIVIDAANYNHVFVTYGGIAPQPVWETTDGGGTWHSASGTGTTGLPGVPARFMSMHPDNPKWLFVGTMIGLYTSVDGGQTWSTNNYGPANVDTWDCKFMPGTSVMLLGTHGRGVWTQNEIAMNTITTAAGTVNAGASVNGTVNVYGHAYLTSETVHLTATNGVTVPATVSITNGNNSATFTATVPAAASGTSAITATIYGTTATATITIQPKTVGLSSVSVTGLPVKGGTNTTGTVTMTGTAPSGGLLVNLSSSNTNVATVPATAAVFAGSTSGSFTITTKAVTANTTVTITASRNGVVRTAVLNVDPLAMAITQVTISSPSVTGGSNDTGIVQISDKAPAAGSVISLTASNKVHVEVPASFTIGAGLTSGSFTIRTAYVNANLAVTITASYNGTTKSATITLTPIQLAGFTLAPTTLVGGAGGQSTATLNGKAYGDSNGGTVVIPLKITFKSSPTGLAVFPASSQFAIGATYGYFGFTTNGVNASTLVTVTATVNNSSKMATVTLTPAALSSLHAATATVAGGKADVITALLNGKAGSGGKVVTLKSSNTAALTVPASATVLQNATQVTFNASTVGVNADTAVTITGTSGTTSVSTSVTVKAPHVSSIALGAPSVQGGKGTFGAAYLDAQAGPAGAVVKLASSNTAVATVPASFTIGKGLTGGTFSITTKAVATTQSVTISATYGGVTKSIVLTVTH